MFSRYKIFAAYLFAIPLALILGFLSASPDDLTVTLICLLLFFLSLPLLLRWHHAFLIIFWNSAFCFIFLPGQPGFWMVLAALSFSISFLNYVVSRQKFLSVPEMNKPIIFLTIVILGTAFFRGGIGLKAIGSASHGGRYYLYILGAFIGYYALTAEALAVGSIKRMASLYFLSGLSSVLGNIAYTLGPAFYFIFYFVPSNLARSQASADLGLTDVDRITGLGNTCVCALLFLLGIYGLRGLLAVTRPWRLLFLCVVVGASLFSGFRSVFVFLFIILAFQFYFEGLFRTRIFFVVLGLTVVGACVIFALADKLPTSAQRTLSFLPVKVESSVRADAVGSTDWRVQMWEIVWKEVPRYLWVGKGYDIDPTEMYLTKAAIQMGILNSFEESLLAGDYHSGPLSVIVPFGLAGAVGFIWLLVAGFRVLYGNYSCGDPRFKTVNTVLLSFYCAQIFQFFFVFGAFNSELNLFVGVVGMSVTINGGFKRKRHAAPEVVRTPKGRAFAVEMG